MAMTEVPGGSVNCKVPAIPGGEGLMDETRTAGIFWNPADEMRHSFPAWYVAVFGTSVIGMTASCR